MVTAKTRRKKRKKKSHQDFPPNQNPEYEKVSVTVTNATSDFMITDNNSTNKNNIYKDDRMIIMEIKE